MRFPLYFYFICTLALLSHSTSAHAAETKDNAGNFRRDRLVAWCIVPFDAKKRGPMERAKMVRQLGLQRVAYDWRQQHVAIFEDEILAYKKHGIEYFAFWGSHEKAFALFEKHGLHPQIWQTLPSPTAANQTERVRLAAERILPLAKRAQQLGSKLGLYNHGGWGGEPQNMIAVCEHLRQHHSADNVGIVYNLHHGHGHLDDFAQHLSAMKPYLLCINLNGMTKGGDQRGQKILPLGEGEYDVQLLQTIRESGYRGNIGIIGHTQDDVELRLRDNLRGLGWILPQLDGKSAGPKPQPKTWKPASRRVKPAKKDALGGLLLPNKDGIRRPPITVAAQVQIDNPQPYNILIASDSKRSADHWEIFSMVKSGKLTVYVPGCSPDHVRSQAMLCDGKQHAVRMLYEAERIRLFVDDKLVADERIKHLGGQSLAGELGIGRLVEGELGCSGKIHEVQIASGVHLPGVSLNSIPAAQLLLNWRPTDQRANAAEKVSQENTQTPAYAAEYVTQVLQQAREKGDAHRGLQVFSSAKLACLSCHRIGEHGGSVGPQLDRVGRERKGHEIVESIVWPKRVVHKDFIAHQIIDDRGRSHQGYLVSRTADRVVLKDPAKGTTREFETDEIDLMREVGTLMPERLVAALRPQELADLVRFVTSLGRNEIPADEQALLLSHANAHLHGAAEFAFTRTPLHTEHWPSWEHHVNRDRVYDFYLKQARHFAGQPQQPSLLMEFPGLDGGQQGHWGNQNESTWANGDWNKTELGSLMCGVFRGAGRTVTRGICVRLGDHAVCFNPDTLQYELFWEGGFVNFSSVRHGFVGGLRMVGQARKHTSPQRPQGASKYLGLFRRGQQISFHMMLDGKPYVETPAVENGELRIQRVPYDSTNAQPFQPQWPQVFETNIHLSKLQPYTVDTIELPTDNPWRALLYCSGHDFLSDGNAIVCTMQGDVWRVSGLSHPSRTAQWRRIAAGLHHPQGVVVHNDEIYVLCRDQICKLHDLNSDGETDYYGVFSNAFQTSPAGHDYICGLERDTEGRFYTSSGNQGLVQISADGASARVLATGFRNPDGIGLMPDGTVTVPCSEGGWTPASMICACRPSQQANASTPHFGYRGPRDGKVPELPLAYLPRGIDNSSGGQTYVTSDRWGPLKDQLLHFSFGTGSHFVVLRDEVNGQLQGAIVPLPGEFRSGAHRGRFSHQDGQLYVTGMQGWGSYTPDTGCFHRVRYTGGKTQFPVGFHVHENGVLVHFSAPLSNNESAQHFAQCWNYRYGPGYGSPEFSSRHFGMRGHDVLRIRSSHLLEDGRALFLEIPDLQPVNQLHLAIQTAANEYQELFVTVHQLDKAFTELPGYQAYNKRINPHPIHNDLALATKRVPNPYRKKIANARRIKIETGGNLSYKTRTISAKPGEAIEFTLVNPDVVPHNWALLKPGTLERVGNLANRLISDPEAVLKHYIPASSDVLFYTDVVLPKESTTIYFRAPDIPGRYPFLCTFPGHWKVMNGELIVDK